MRPFTVIWWTPARDELAQLWLNAADRKAITTAADQIDKQLANDPFSTARGVAEGLWRLSLNGLVVQFSADDGDRKVIVWSVRLVY